MSPAEAVHSAAREAYAAGLCVVPTAEDGSKQPIGPRQKWKHFQTQRPTPEELRSWYPGRCGLGVIVGKANDRVECWDFDDRPTYETFLEAARELGLGDVVHRICAGYRDDTPGDGVRWLVRHPEGIERDGQIILAGRPKRPEEMEHPDDKLKRLIELPIHAILAPTNGKVHPTGKPYVHQTGGFDTITEYTAEERDALMVLARSFDVPLLEEERRNVVSAPAHARGSAGSRPGDIWATRTSWSDILEPHGWTKLFTHGGTTYWRRPGKSHGSLSATTNHGGNDTLKVFSTSTVFEPVLESKTSYSKFAAYTILDHGGDFSAAARALAAQGYGDSSSRDREVSASRHDAPHDAEPDYRKQETSEPGPEAGFTPPEHWKWYDLAELDEWEVEPLEPIVDSIIARGNLVLDVSETQTGKSLIGGYEARVFVTGGKLFGKYSVTPVDRVLYIVLEDPAWRFHDRLMDMAHGFPPVEPGRCRFLVAPGFRIDDDAMFLWLGETIQAQGDGHTVVMLDTYQRATPGIASFDDEKQSLILHRLAGLTRTLDCTLIVKDHVRKAASGSKRRGEMTIDEIKGTGGKAQNADCVILMERTADRKQIKFQSFSKDFDEPVRILLNVAPKGSMEPKFSYAGDLEKLGQTSKEKGEKTRKKVLGAMVEPNQRYSTSELAEATGLGASTVKRHLSQLIEDGAVSTNGEKGKTCRYWRIGPKSGWAESGGGQRPREEQHIFGPSDSDHADTPDGPNP